MNQITTPTKAIPPAGKQSSSIVRTRFAPSPTGDLHIGGARVALFCYLYARHHDGQFILRIEDTDRERSTQASVDAILSGLDWLALNYDELYYQTQRMDRYAAIIQRLLDSDHAYRCTCSKERLTELREHQHQMGVKPRYDGHCRDRKDISPDTPHVIRFRTPDTGVVQFTDAVRGEISIENRELDDFVIAREDGTPTYNFTVVVDDWEMEITHVIRGDDHINNTPRQINVFHALNAPIPVYAHLPMILGEDGKRLSKRHGATNVISYREWGYLPDALCNYLVRLGWSHGDQEVFSREDMIALFDLTHINHAPAALNSDKLRWLNHHYLMESPPDTLVGEFTARLKQIGVQEHEIAEAPAPLAMIVAEQLSRCKTLLEMAEKSRFFFQPITEYAPKAAKWLSPAIVPVFTDVLMRCESLIDWNPGNLHAVIESVAEQHGLKLGKVAQPIRVAVTGDTVSPPMDITLSVLGQTRVLRRLQQAITWINEQY